MAAKLKWIVGVGGKKDIQVRLDGVLIGNDKSPVNYPEVLKLYWTKNQVNQRQRIKIA